LLMCAKNLPKAKVYPTLFKKLVLDGMIGLVYLLQFKFRLTFAILRAHLAFYKMLSSTALLRKNTDQNNRYYLRNSILIDYFVFRRLNFRDLNKNYK